MSSNEPSLVDYFEISNYLQDMHEIFYKFFNLGRPVLCDDLPTAAVCFNKDGDYIQFRFNKDFWDSLNNYTRAFIIAHECMHVILNHGKRAKASNITNMLNKATINVAMDIVINHTLTNSLKFRRKALKVGFDLCFIDTVFKEKSKNILQKQNFEYYYNELKKDSQTIEIFMAGQQGGSGEGSLDSHENLPEMTLDQLLDQIVDGAGKEKEEKIKEIKDKIQNFDKQPGVGSLDELLNTITKKIVYKRKWEKIVEGMNRTIKGKIDRDLEQWVKTDRRYSLLSKEILLPAQNAIEDLEKAKWDIWFFQDISGSCVHLVQRFLDAARSIPIKYFNIRFHTFDTQVKYIPDLYSNNIRGGGGTCFKCIEDYIQREISSKNIKYPNLVFCLTDGYGTEVNPQFPDRWFWFLSENYTACIPNQSKRYDLNEFE